MVALTRDFHVLASRSTAYLSAKLVAIGHTAQARYVRAHSRFFICYQDSTTRLHHGSTCTSDLIASKSPNLRPLLT